MEIGEQNSHEIAEIRHELDELKSRMARLESLLAGKKGKIIRHTGVVAGPDDEGFELKLLSGSEKSIEFRMGEYGMAWLGNVVLLFGITFLVQYLQNSGQQLLSVCCGFLAVASIYTSAWFTRKAFAYLSALLSHNGHILLFYMTLLLHFAHGQPLISNPFLGVALLTFVPSVLFYKAFRQKSQLLAGMSLIMFLTTGILGNSIGLVTGFAAMATVLVMFLYKRFGWIRLVFLFVFLVYLIHLNGLLNNPLGGNTPELVASPGAEKIWLIVSGFVFSLLALIPKKENVSDDFIITTIVWNGLGFTFLLVLMVVNYFLESYVPLMSVISLFCLGYAVLLQAKSPLKIAASMYALYGFLAMSVAFYGLLLFPKAYTLLVIQSLLVVSMALWFRSRFIVVMNSLLFILLFALYMSDKSNLNSIDFAFMLVAFITARVLNWKKERLNIKTELIRNIYLIIGFAMTLISFYHAFPKPYITASWILAALLFFLMSRLINNIKYRWLAISALMASAVKLIFIDLKQIDIGVRVLMFLVLAAISITISIIYTRFLTRKKESEKAEA